MKEEIKLEKKILNAEWIKFLDFLYRHKKQAEVAREPVYLMAMEEQIKISETWFKNIYGERNLKKVRKKYQLNI